MKKTLALAITLLIAILTLGAAAPTKIVNVDFTQGDSIDWLKGYLACASGTPTHADLAQENFGFVQMYADPVTGQINRISNPGLQAVRIPVDCTYSGPGSSSPTTHTHTNSASTPFWAMLNSLLVPALRLLGALVIIALLGIWLAIRVIRRRREEYLDEIIFGDEENEKTGEVAIPVEDRSSGRHDVPVLVVVAEDETTELEALEPHPILATTEIETAPVATSLPTLTPAQWKQLTETGSFIANGNQIAALTMMGVPIYVRASAEGPLVRFCDSKYSLPLESHDLITEPEVVAATEADEPISAVTLERPTAAEITRYDEKTSTLLKKVSNS